MIETFWLAFGAICSAIGALVILSIGLARAYRWHRRRRPWRFFEGDRMFPMTEVLAGAYYDSATKYTKHKTKAWRDMTPDERAPWYWIGQGDRRLIEDGKVPGVEAVKPTDDDEPAALGARHA